MIRLLFSSVLDNCVELNSVEICRAGIVFTFANKSLNVFDDDIVVLLRYSAISISNVCILIDGVRDSAKSYKVLLAIDCQSVWLMFKNWKVPDPVTTSWLTSPLLPIFMNSLNSFALLVSKYMHLDDFLTIISTSLSHAIRFSMIDKIFVCKYSVRLKSNFIGAIFRTQRSITRAYCDLFTIVEDSFGVLWETMRFLWDSTLATELFVFKLFFGAAWLTLHFLSLGSAQNTIRRTKSSMYAPPKLDMDIILHRYGHKSKNHQSRCFSSSTDGGFGTFFFILLDSYSHSVKKNRWD